MFRVTWRCVGPPCRYGIGQIYLRQEKYELAENHFRRALTINPGSSVLMCYLGMALHKMGKNDEALEQLQVCRGGGSFSAAGARYAGNQHHRCGWV